MDIRKFFSSSQTKKVDPVPGKSQPTTCIAGNGLSKERELKLSPSPKQTKKRESKSRAKHTLYSDDSDGECPLPESVQIEVKKSRRRTLYISSDEEDDSANLLSVSAAVEDKPKPRRSPRKAQHLPPDTEPTLVDVEPVTRRKLHQTCDAGVAPMTGVFTNKKRKHQVVHGDTARDGKKEDVLAAEKPKRSKIDEEEILIDIEQKLFSEGKEKPKKSTKAAQEKIKPPSFHKTRSGEEFIQEEEITAASTNKTPTQSKIKPPKKEKGSPKKRLVSEADLVVKPEIIETIATKTKKPTPSPKKVAEKKTTKSPKKEKGTSPKKCVVTEADLVVKSEILREPTEKREKELPWVDKYKPTQQRDLVGQLTEKSPYNKLLNWLREWPKNNLGAGAQQKKARPAPWLAQNDGSSFKAALLSGPPGIGKTTCAVFACKELNLRYMELNASDARNKKSIEQHVSALLDNRRMDKYYFTSEGEMKSKIPGIDQVLIMDEVDGMSGNQDRAGIAELILMIKRTKIPIICICNDRQSTKIRSLANHCFDLRFSRPRAEQIKVHIVFVGVEVLDKVIEASNHDLRQCVHNLQLMSSVPINANQSIQKKDISVNIFDAARKILSAESNLAEKQEMFFSDYAIMPLFVQENYPSVRAPRIGNAQHINSIRRAAESISFGDIVDKQIRSLGAWNLLVDQAMFSCVLPATIMNGHMSEQISFPSWFGKYSTLNKRQRLMRQLSTHTNLGISGSNHALVVDYLPVMRERMYRPLLGQDSNKAVKEVLQVYDSYNLVRDDTEAINELGVWPNKKDIAQSVATKAKSALTRALNKEKRLLPYAQANTVVKGRRKGGAATVGGQFLSTL
ncbi:ATPase family associated with various cellular activities (AAA) domain-containing protein [Ditylenchus destructor]|uniref:ATPase family associated with various cellular activities (AAA) domain-containing protein n=1 Tax=Ditylenchus destructor TaxID=166010 RepID=A0AAD4QZ66_9BILA|nr:ATPase family associated with various cellular activities (AAA) domain-containing protein [Ditylenchus destructor]